MQTVLIVTWFYLSQPPVSSQIVFESQDACARAQLALRFSEEKIKNSYVEREQPAAFGTIKSVVPPYPTLSAVCSPLK